MGGGMCGGMGVGMGGCMGGGMGCGMGGGMCGGMGGGMGSGMGGMGGGMGSAMGGGMGGAMGGGISGSMSSALSRDGGGLDGGRSKGGEGRGGGSGGGSRSNPAVEGARLQGILKSLTTESGFISCPQVPGDVQFQVRDLPLVLRARAQDDPDMALVRNATMLFTLSLGVDGKPRGREVMPVPAPEDVIYGTVKTYSTSSGYGFINPLEDSTFTHDVYFNHKDLPTTGEDMTRMQLSGVCVGFRVRLTFDGRPQAKQIELKSRPDGVGSGPGSETAESTGETLPGIIKTFKQSAGYGFISCAVLGRDVWFARRELPSSLVREDLPGQEVLFELWVTSDEKPQARRIQVPGAVGAAASDQGRATSTASSSAQESPACGGHLHPAGAGGAAGFPWNADDSPAGNQSQGSAAIPPPPPPPPPPLQEIVSAKPVREELAPEQPVMKQLGPPYDDAFAALGVNPSAKRPAEHDSDELVDAAERRAAKRQAME